MGCDGMENKVDWPGQPRLWSSLDDIGFHGVIRCVDQESMMTSDMGMSVVGRWKSRIALSLRLQDDF